MLLLVVVILSVTVAAVTLLVASKTTSQTSGKLTTDLKISVQTMKMSRWVVDPWMMGHLS